MASEKKKALSRNKFYVQQHSLFCQIEVRFCQGNLHSSKMIKQYNGNRLQLSWEDVFFFLWINKSPMSIPICAAGTELRVKIIPLGASSNFTCPVIIFQPNKIPGYT